MFVVGLLLRVGVSLDVVMFVGMLGVAVGVFVFYLMGYLFIGMLVIMVFVFSDIVDGIMVCVLGCFSVWGVYFDFIFDWVGDVVIFGGFVFWYFGCW